MEELSGMGPVWEVFLTKLRCMQITSINDCLITGHVEGVKAAMNINR